jgi:hypothetical protein
MTRDWLAQNKCRLYFVWVISVNRCSACSAQLFPEAKFCRQCGATVTAGNAVNPSEEPTQALNERLEDVITRRLDPRPTSPGRASQRTPSGKSIDATSLPAPSSSPPRRKFPTALLLGSAVLIIVIAIVSSAIFMRMRSRSSATGNAELIYPGAETVVDMTSDEGRSIHLQTGDSLERVLAWYDANLKPTKRMRLTSTSVVLRSQNVTATIASEDNKTNILIKQSLTP